MDPCTAALDYLATVTGAPHQARPVTQSALAGLPAELAQAYALAELQLFGHTVLLVSLQDDAQAGLAELARDREQLAAALGRPVVLVLPRLRAFERQRLIQRQVPFLVPGRQLFLPMLLVDLREAYPAAPRPPVVHLSWVAQVLVLRQQLWDDVAGRPLARLATMLGYSQAAISQAAAELLALKLCRPVVAGRTKRLEFAAPDLWRQALPFLRSPVKKRLALERLDESVKPRAQRAGRTALADYLNLERGGAPEILALYDWEVRRRLAGGKCRACPLEADARAILECWGYPPGLLSAEAAVDPLSLYLSLRRDPEARLRQAADRLLSRSV